MSIEELFAPFPVTLSASSSCSSGAGRSVIASRDIKVGELVLCSAAVGFTTHRKHIDIFCGYCLTYTEDPNRLPLPFKPSCCQNVVSF